MTYKELWNKWLEEKSHYLCSSTVKSRKYCAEAQVLPYIGEIDIRDLSLENLLPVMNAATAETNKVLMSGAVGARRRNNNLAHLRARLSGRARGSRKNIK